MTDKEVEGFIKNARLKMVRHENMSEAEQLVIALLDSGRRLSNEEIDSFIYFMDIKYEEFKDKQNYNEEIETDKYVGMCLGDTWEFVGMEEEDNGSREDKE